MQICIYMYINIYTCTWICSCKSVALDSQSAASTALHRELPALTQQAAKGLYTESSGRSCSRRHCCKRWMASSRDRSISPGVASSGVLQKKKRYCLPLSLDLTCHRQSLRFQLMPDTPLLGAAFFTNNLSRPSTQFPCVLATRLLNSWLFASWASMHSSKYKTLLFTGC
jgi:hypothetical protein